MRVKLVATIVALFFLISAACGGNSSSSSSSSSSGGAGGSSSSGSSSSSNSGSSSSSSSGGQSASGTNGHRLTGDRLIELTLAQGGANGLVQIDRNGDAFVELAKGARTVNGNCKVGNAPGFTETVAVANGVSRSQFEAFDVLLFDGWAKQNGVRGDTVLYGKGPAAITRDQLTTVAKFAQNVANTCIAVPADMRGPQ